MSSINYLNKFKQLLLYLNFYQFTIIRQKKKHFMSLELVILVIVILMLLLYYGFYIISHKH